MRRIAGVGILLPALLLLVAGCATRGWVRQALGQQEDQISQRLGRVEGQVGQVEGQVGRVEGQVSRVEGQVGRVEGQVGQVEGRFKAVQVSVDEAGGAARVAREQADAALAKAGSVDGRLTRLWANRHNMRVADTVEVHFPFNRSDLGDAAQTALLRIVKELQDNPGLAVELAGYTDSQGAREYNYQLSQRRVESVRRFLVEKGIPLFRIQAIGLGPIPDSGMPQEKKRRVTVKLLADQE
jgi:outer membrane protein OmpA-like peptidoglycan-associated protein